MADQLRSVADLHATGDLVVVEMDDNEQDLFASLCDEETVQPMGLIFPLAPSAAASVAVATERDWVLASDDRDACSIYTERTNRQPIGSENLLARTA